VVATPLSTDVSLLEGRGFVLQQHAQPDGWIFVVFVDYQLGPAFTPRTSEMLVKVPPTYPYAGLDMFWVSPEVRLANGTMPANTSVETLLSRQWLRFSWHPATWRYGVDNLPSFLAFINERLSTGN
jgi:Prokaryotic E2 family E